MRKVFVIAILVGIIILIAHHFSQPKPLRPIVVTWQEVGEVNDLVDLDTDGNDELVVQDTNGQWWWVQFNPTAIVRQKFPVPEEAYYYFCIPRKQTVTLFEHPKTRQIFLVARKGKKWVLKDLGERKLVETYITDVDRDGQVNDVIVWRGQTRKVFSRMKDGTIVERLNLPDFQVDLDGDGKDDAVYVMKYRLEKEVRICFSSGRKVSLKLPLCTITIADLDDNKVAEIVGIEKIYHSHEFYPFCWYYKNEKWYKSLGPKFIGMGQPMYDDLHNDLFDYLPIFRDEKSSYLLVIAKEGRQAKIWKVRLRKGKWIKQLMGEVPETNIESIEGFSRVGNDWLVFGWTPPPRWQKWLWEKVGQHLQRFLPFLHRPQDRFFAYSWDGQRKWTLLGRWRVGQWRLFPSERFLLADMDGDGKQEIVIGFPKMVLVVKFEDGRWRKVWVKVPFVEYMTMGGFRYGGRKWALFQEWDSHRCVAIALERQK